MSFDPFPDEYLRQLREKYADRKTDFDAESSLVIRNFEAVRTRLVKTYTFDKILAVGGTGIVHSGHHNRFQQFVVLKINRPNPRPEESFMVANEAQLLPTLSHPNIISVIDQGTLCIHGSAVCDCDQNPENCAHRPEDCSAAPKLTYIVEPFIAGSKPFFTNKPDEVKSTWLYEKTTELTRVMPEWLELGHGDDSGQAVGRITSLLSEVAELFSQWVSLLSHIHSPHVLAEDGYVYLDVKPENVLVDEHSHLTSIDFGSATKFDPNDPRSINVVFTDQYAHRKLKESKKSKASSNRVLGGIKRSDVKYAFDYFALGMSMLEILSEIANIRPHVVPQLPLYRSLHFLAARLLDGENSNRRDRNYQYASQVFPGLRAEDYETLRYDNLNDTHRDLEKELGRWNLEKQVPELATYSKDIVRLVPGYNTVLTPRLRGVIEHPLVARLKYVTQLGLVSLVYPTADHSRYDHSLGSYTYTTYYIKSLFNDLGNPLFRNLVGIEDLNAVLLAALLHDLGQYPLAHDLEEVHDQIFNHGRIGLKLLQDPMQDRHDRTLLQIIEDQQNGWRVTADALGQILGKASKNLTLAREHEKASLKTNVLAAIVDGQVDADKADYIIRDSVRCELPYGAQLDLERLLRVLTVAIIPEESDLERRVTLGVYDKGKVSAHAFGQARYELLSTVYWHHTARIIKTMLQYATALGLPLDVFNPDKATRESKELEIRELLLDFVKSLVPPFQSPPKKVNRRQARREADLDLAAEPGGQVISLINDDSDRKNNQPESAEEIEWYPGIAWTDWLMLRWIAHLPNASSQSKNLIYGIQTRRLYKRVATFPRSGAYADLVRKLDGLPWTKRVELCRQLHEHVSNQLRSKWANVNTATLRRADFEKLCESHLLILVDIPSSSQKIGYKRPLAVVPELREKSYNQETRQATEDEDWRKIMNEMIDGIAPVRVVCGAPERFESIPGVGSGIAREHSE